MGFTKTHLVLLIVTISMLFAPTTNAVAGLVKPIRTPQARVYAMCKPTTYPSLCFKTILPKALVTPKFNRFKAIDLEIQIASALINKTLDFIRTLKPKYANDKNISEALRVCDDEYCNMIDSITETYADIALHDFNSATFKMGNANTYGSDCKDAYVECGIVAPFKADADLISQHVSNCMDIMAPIVQKERNAVLEQMKKDPNIIL